MNHPSAKNRYPFQVLIVDALIILLVPLLTIILGKGMFIGVDADESRTLAITIPLFVFAIICFAMFIYIDKKYNRLKVNNIFSYLAIAIAIFNLITIIALPTKINLPNNQTYEITTVERIYSIIFGFADALLIFSLFYLVPRKIMHTKWIVLIAYVIVGVSFFFIVASFFTDWKNYIEIFKSGIGSEHAICSLAGHQIVFGRILLSGTFGIITLHIYKKKWPYLLLFIPILIEILFVYSKTAIVLIYLVVLIYVITLLVLLAKKNKDNLIIIIAITSFVLIIGAVLIVLTHFSNYGLLFKIKTAFYNALKGAKATFNSRMLIWDNTVRMLNESPLFWIMGFGGSMFGVLLNITYTHDPSFADYPNMSYAHNATMEILGRGGVIFLLINVFFFAYVVYLIYKNYHRNKVMSIMSYVFIGVLFIDGLVESNYLLVEGDNIIFMVIAVLPIIAIDNIYGNKEEMQIRKDIVSSAKKVKKTAPSNWLLKMNAKKIVFEAKRISQDYNKKKI